MNRRANTFIRQLGTTTVPTGLGYGRLYNWYAVDDARNISPINCHVPTDTEWSTLTTYLGGISVSGGKLKESGLSHWETPNTGADNSSGFTAFGTGYRIYNGDYASINNINNLWSSTPRDASYIWTYVLVYNKTTAFRNYYSRIYGFSVRCICDTADSTITDIDGNIYDTVVIGTQRWLLQNLKVTKYRNGESIPNVTSGGTWEGLTTGAMCAYDNDEGNV